MQKIGLGVSVGLVGLLGTWVLPTVHVLPSSFAHADMQLAQSPAVEKKQNIIVHLYHSTNDLHAAFMALKLARGMQKKGNAQVTLLLTMEGVRLVDKKQPLNLRWGSDPMTLEKLYNEFVAAGGQVRVCPVCAAAVGITVADLRPGAQMAQGAQDIPSLVGAADKVINF